MEEVDLAEEQPRNREDAPDPRIQASDVKEEEEDVATLMFILYLPCPTFLPGSGRRDHS